MHFPIISRAGIATDEEFCPYCQVMREDWDGWEVCDLCHHDTRQRTGPAVRTCYV